MLLGTVGADVLLPTSGGFTVEVDWDRDGDYSTFLDDVTSRVRPNQSAVSVEYGRDQSTALSPTVAGRGGFVLDNHDRYLSPRNASSPLYGKVKPARPVRITRTIGSTVYQLFDGHTDDSPLNPDLDNRAVAVSLLDALADFRGQTISTPLYRDLRSGEAIGLILDACGWTGGRDIDLGATIIPWWWEDNTDALTALEKVVRSEGPPALLSVGAGGAIVFRDRHHRLTRTQSLVSQSTWRASGQVEPVMATGFTYDESWSKIINTGTATVDVRALAEESAVWSSDATIALTPGETRIVTVSTSDPFMNARIGDFILGAGSGPVTLRLTRTSGASTGVVITCGSVGAILTSLQVVASPLAVAYSVQVSASDSQSITDYGPRSYPGDLPWCGFGDAQAVLSTAVALRCKPLPVLSVRFVIGTDYSRCKAILERDLGDRVTVVENQTALNDAFCIESIRHDMTSEYDHTVTFGLEAVPVQPTVSSSNPIRFDGAGTGFGLGSFGDGLTYTTTLFRFDQAAGFGIGAFAA